MKDYSHSPVAKIVITFLSSPSSERAVRQQILELANKNLHDPAVINALVDSLDIIRDRESRHEVLCLLFQQEANRFPDFASFVQQLILLLDTEKERDFRLEIFEFLITNAGKLPFVGEALVRAVLQPGIQEEEAEMLIEGLADIPSLSTSTLELLIVQNKNAEYTLQCRLLQIILRVPEISHPMSTALMQWLEAHVSSDIVNQVLQIVSKAGKINAAIEPVLCKILQTDQLLESRLLCLDLLQQTPPWAVTTTAQIIVSAETDQSPQVRRRAHELLRASAQPDTQAQQLRLADVYFTETNPEVREVIWLRLKPFLREETCRNHVLQLIGQHSLAGLGNGKFKEILHSFFPYFRRKPEVKSVWMGKIASVGDVSKKRILLEEILPQLDLATDLDWVVGRFRDEIHEPTKELLFTKLEALSIVQYPALVDLYVEELFDPSSAFRLKSATVLSLAVKPEATHLLEALEDVLLFDTHAALLRVCLKAYLLPKIPKKLEVILKVLKNESIELALRKQALKQYQQENVLTPAQQQLFDEVRRAHPNLI